MPSVTECGQCQLNVCKTLWSIVTSCHIVLVKKQTFFFWDILINQHNSDDVFICFVILLHSCLCVMTETCWGKQIFTCGLWCFSVLKELQVFLMLSITPVCISQAPSMCFWEWEVLPLWTQWSGQSLVIRDRTGRKPSLTSPPVAPSR